MLRPSRKTADSNRFVRSNGTSIVTVLEIIQRGAEYLTQKGVESPRLQVELLLSRVLGMPRLKLYLEFERQLTPQVVDTLRELVKRRGQREPLQHLIGTVSFCGLELVVNPSVLIPRPETELLAEHAWSYLNSPPVPFAAPPQVLDFGTGSGCLAIVLAEKCPPARIWALDISPEALAVARENAGRHFMAQRIQFVEGDGFAALPAGLKFDLIVANPPYIPASEIAKLEPEVRDHDPRQALDGGADGLDFYRRLAVETPAWLQPDGRLMMEFGDGQADALEILFVPPAWTTRAEKDFSGRLRYLIAQHARLI